IFFHFRFKSVPIAFQLTLGLQPSGLTGISLLLNELLKLVALFMQVRDVLIGLRSRVSLHLVSFGFERRQNGIHFVDPLFRPIEIEMHAALRGHDDLQSNASPIPLKFPSNLGPTLLRPNWTMGQCAGAAISANSVFSKFLGRPLPPSGQKQTCAV